MVQPSKSQTGKTPNGTLFHTSSRCRIVSRKHTGDIAPKWRPTPTSTSSLHGRLGKEKGASGMLISHMSTGKHVTSRLPQSISMNFHNIHVYIYIHIFIYIYIYLWISYHIPSFINSFYNLVRGAFWFPNAPVPADCLTIAIQTIQGKQLRLLFWV
jgi:hypothetical protein